MMGNRQTRAGEPGWKYFLPSFGEVLRAEATFKAGIVRYNDGAIASIA